MLSWFVLHLLVQTASAQSECQVNLLMNPYTGNMTRTNLGRTCQAWSSQYPRRHLYTEDSMFPDDGSVENAKNYCRKSSRLPLPWCYTTDVDLPWDNCDWMICHPPASDCGGILSADSGSISNPDLDNDGYYDNWMECFWEVRAGESNIIRITLLSVILDIDSALERCNLDYIEAWEPHAKIFRLCGGGLRGLAFDTQYNVLHIHFFADEIYVQYGFELWYEQLPAPTCGGEIRGSVGEFRPADLDGDGLYDANLNCTWFLRVNYFHEIRLAITQIDIKPTENCESAYLEIHQFLVPGFVEERLTDRICTRAGTINITTPYEIRVRFTSDESSGGTGFIARFTQTPDTSDCWHGEASRQYGGKIRVTNRGRICQHWISQIPHTHEFSDMQFPLDGSAVLAENFCRDPVEKGSPFCFTVDPEMKADFCDLRICRGDPDCIDGYVTMAYNGNVSKTNHGLTCQAWASQTPHSHSLTDSYFPHDGYSKTAASNYCRVVGGDVNPWCFTTDPDVQWDYCVFPICRGYYQECGGILRKKSGTISSPDFDGDGLYDPYSLCMWRIEGGPGTITEVEVTYIDIFPSDFCTTDYLEIFADGISLALYCGQVIPDPVLTASLVTMVKFVIFGDTNLRTGFIANYRVTTFHDAFQSSSTTQQVSNDQGVDFRGSTTSQIRPVNYTQPPTSPRTNIDYSTIVPVSRAVLPTVTPLPENPTPNSTQRRPLPTYFALRTTDEPSEVLSTSRSTPINDGSTIVTTSFPSAESNTTSSFNGPASGSESVMRAKFIETGSIWKLLRKIVLYFSLGRCFSYRFTD